jgi:hypothetical protein
MTATTSSKIEELEGLIAREIADDAGLWKAFNPPRWCRDAAAKAVTRLKPVLEENERLRSKVETAAVIFEEYGRLHRKKGTREGDMKAAANERYAAEMRAALSQKGER